ncbi:MAG: hypothetical protein RJB68_2523 [Pseudomonadota bacterium]|jgi:hypothetical protein
MLAVGNPIKDRLADLLTDWSVRLRTDVVEKRQFPAVEVGIDGAQVADSKTGAVSLTPNWAVTLVVRRGDLAAAQLDEAFAGVVESLHNWAPGAQGGRNWERLRLVSVREPDFADEGVAGVVLVFSTGARYDGQP